MQANAPECPRRLYAIKYEPDNYFFCGVAPSGDQVLMGLGEDPEVILLSFDRDGSFKACHRRQVPLAVPEHLPPGQKLMQEADQLTQAMEAWQAELGVRPADIAVRHFFIPELDIGTADMPGGYTRASERLAALPEEQQRELERDIAEWKVENRYVLWWGKEYWMNEAGEVTDT
jgi:hypothetical protein